jgi:hypothetical protein
MIQRSDQWHTRSTLSKLAHILARLGLALIGASSGLFVAAAVAVIQQINSAEVLLAMMLYGAAACYLGIDLPQPPAGRRIGLRPGLGTSADMLEVLTAAGIFLTAVAAVASVFSIIFGETLATSTARIICFGWAIGATMQIAAGVVARIKLARAERTAKQALFFR